MDLEIVMLHVCMCSIKLWISYLLFLETMWLTSWEGMLRAACSSSSVRLEPSIVYISIKKQGSRLSGS